MDTIKEIKNSIKKLDWSPGNLLYFKNNKGVFWKLQPNLPIEKSLTNDINFTIGASGVKNIHKDEILMFLGVLKTEVSNSKKKYPILQFLLEDDVVFLDCNALYNNAVPLSFEEALEHLFEPIKIKC